MFPTIHTDHIYKFLCVSGLILVVLTNIARYDLHKESNESSKNFINDRLLINSDYINNLDFKNENEIDSIRIEFLLENRKIKSESLTVHYDIQQKATLSRMEEYQKLSWVGFALFFIGFLLWGRYQRRLDIITLSESIKAERQYTDCQSCGTELQYIEIDQAKIYCSHCHNGYSFIEPKLSKSDMEIAIRTRMEAQSFTEKKITEQIKKLGDLYRWKSIFKW